MSAWIVTAAHIDALVQAATEAGLCEDKPEAQTRLGRMLWRENHRSINARYGDELRTPTYKFIPLKGKALDAPAVVQSLARCYDYQSCEHSGWMSSKARLITLALIGTCAEYVRNDGLKGPWGIGAGTPARKAFVQGEGVPAQVAHDFGVAELEAQRELQSARLRDGNPVPA